MPDNINFSLFSWINEPDKYKITKSSITIHTNPETDFWQRTYYGFRHNNAHAFVFPIDTKNFTFTVQAQWQPRKLFDQCGIILYEDPDNWFKASVEYDNEKYSRLGSVVTNLGFSDWATTDIESSVNKISYRLSCRNQDFLLESSMDGEHFNQMRIFHMHLPIARLNIGIYACSPLQSSIQAKFSNFHLGSCMWEPYSSEQD